MIGAALLIVITVMSISPLFVYVCVKCGTFAYYRGKWKAQKYNNSINETKE